MLEFFDSDTLLQSAAHEWIVMIIKIELGLDLNSIEVVASSAFLIPRILIKIIFGSLSKFCSFFLFDQSGIVISELCKAEFLVKGIFFSKSADAFVISSNTRTFYFPELKNLNLVTEICLEI